MNTLSRRVAVSGLILAVCFLVLMPHSPESVATAAYTHGSDPTLNGQTGSDPTVTFTHTFPLSTVTFTHTAFTTHSFPGYTNTEYVPAPVQVQYCYPNDPYCNGYSQYPCYPGYPGYPYACYPNYPYQYQTTTTATTTSYSTLTQTSLTTSTSTSISIPQPVFVTNTLTITTTTTNTTMETVYGTLMAVFLALFLASLLLLINARSGAATSLPPSATQQAYVAASYRCSSCGNDVLPQSKFCANCGVPLKT